MLVENIEGTNFRKSHDLKTNPRRKLRELMLSIRRQRPIRNTDTNKETSEKKVRWESKYPLEERVVEGNKGFRT